jgi:hypothetical protein
VGRESYVFEGLDEIEGRIRRLCGDISYLALSDRTERNQEEQLGRFDFTAKDALPYLEQGHEADPDGSSEEPEEDGAFALDEAEPDEPDEEVSEEEEDSPENRKAFAEAGCLWLRDIAQRNTVGEAYRRFRLKVYGPKGLRVVDTASFVCKNVDYDLELPVAVSPPEAVREPELRMPVPTFEQAEAQGAARGMRALGDYYNQWGQIMLGSASQLQAVNNAMLARVSRQLESSQGQVDKLVASILEYRMAELKLAEERKADERADDSRTELARHALQQLGEAAKAFLATRGVPPELADVLGALGQSPALVSALNEPEVRELIAEPQNLELIAGMLRQAGQQARLLRPPARTP